MRLTPTTLKLLGSPLIHEALWAIALALGHLQVERVIAAQRSTPDWNLSGWELWAYAPLLPVFVLMSVTAHGWKALLGRAVLLSSLTFAYLLWAGLTSQPGFGGHP